MNHKLMLSVMFTLAMCISPPVDSSGPFVYVTPFFDEPSFDDMLLGDFSDKFHGTSMSPLIVYLHLTGKFTERHAALFRAVRIDQQAQHRFPQHSGIFTDLLSTEGYPPVYFYTWKHLTRTVTENGTANIIHYNIYNCLEDAFRVASETLEDRRTRYGSGSPELRRWIEAQIKFSIIAGRIHSIHRTNRNQTGSRWKNTTGVTRLLQATSTTVSIYKRRDCSGK